MWGGLRLALLIISCASLNILHFQIGIILKDFLKAHAACQKLQKLGHRKTHVTDDWFAAKYIGVGRDAIKQ